MKIIGKYLQVKELVKDLSVNGLLQKYDDSSPYILAEIVNAEQEIYNKLSTYGDVDNLVVIFRRPNKLPFLDTFFVSNEDIIAIMSKEEFEAL